MQSFHITDFIPIELHIHLYELRFLIILLNVWSSELDESIIKHIFEIFIIGIGLYKKTDVFRFSNNDKNSKY